MFPFLYGTSLILIQTSLSEKTQTRILKQNCSPRIVSSQTSKQSANLGNKSLNVSVGSVSPGYIWLIWWVLWLFGDDEVDIPQATNSNNVLL